MSTEWRKLCTLIMCLKLNCFDVTMTVHLSRYCVELMTSPIALKLLKLMVFGRATENRFFAGSDRFLVCKTDSICIKRIFFGPKKPHFADHILAQFPGLVKCQTVNCP